MEVELTLLTLSLLFFLSIFTDKIGYRFGIPALVLFLGVGMLFGPEVLGRWVDGGTGTMDLGSAQAISTIALCIILFSGGLDTKIADIQPVLKPGVTLATVGVLLTCVITGVLIYYIFGWLNAVASVSIWVAMLMAATMSSTDSASVFSILRTNNVKLKHNLRPLMELESGANDPMAYILTITLIGIVTTGAGNVTVLSIIQEVTIQLVMGSVMGFFFGKMTVELLKKLHLNNESLYSIMVLTACIFIFSITYFLKGNPYLAVYIGGLIIGNSKFTRKRQTKSFFEGLTWLSQLSMFLMLGLMAYPSQLIQLQVWLPCLIISIVMIFISRPIAVALSLFPWRQQYKQRDRVMVSWVGLRGAVPIIFAILCMSHGVPHADLLFNVVFLCTLISLLVQGTTIGAVAQRLKLAEPESAARKLYYFDIDIPEEVESSAHETLVTEELIRNGSQLKDVAVPKHSLVIMVRRGDNFFVPKGDTELQLGDYLLVISDENEKKVIQAQEDEDEQMLTHSALHFLQHTRAFIHDRWHKLIRKE